MFRVLAHAKREILSNNDTRARNDGKKSGAPWVRIEIFCPLHYWSRCLAALAPASLRFGYLHNRDTR